MHGRPVLKLDGDKARHGASSGDSRAERVVGGWEEVDVQWTGRERLETTDGDRRELGSSLQRPLR